MSAGRESPPPTAAAARVAAPAYLTQDASFRLDLSCLLDEAVRDDDDDDALDAVKAIDILAGHWPSDTLQEVTTLDQSQLLALQVRMLHDVDKQHNKIDKRELLQLVWGYVSKCISERPWPVSSDLADRSSAALVRRLQKDFWISMCKSRWSS